MHRLAWTVADLRGVDRPGADELDVALRLRSGDPLLARHPAGARMTARMSGEPTDRVARVALSRLGEPGDPRLAALVGGARRDAAVYRLLREERDARPAWPPTSPPGCAGSTPSGDLERAATPRDPVRRAPATRSGRRSLGDLDRAEPLQRPRRRAARAVGAGTAAARTSWPTGRSRWWARARRRPTARGGRRDRRRRSPRRGSAWCRARPSASTRPRTAGALAARGPTVAVLACGVDRAYPAAHRDLLAYIADDRPGRLRAARRAAHRPSCASCPATG